MTHCARAIVLGVLVCLAMQAPAPVAAQKPAPGAAQEPAPGAAAVTVTGVVRDAISDARLAGASVQLDDSQTFTDVNGAFSLAGVSTGAGLLRIELFGYEELVVPVTVTPELEPLELRLQPAPFALEGLEVTGRDRVALTGAVLDERSEFGLPFASLTLGDRRSVAADGNGSFRITRVEPGRYLLLAERLGYESLYVPLNVTGPLEPMVIRLEADPILLEGITVMTDRMRSRRRAFAAGSTRSYGEARLNRSAAADMLQFLQYEAFLRPTPCGSGGNVRPWDGAAAAAARATLASGACVVGRGGRPRQSKVFIDEVLIPCGLTMLGTYRPEDLYLLEIYDNGGQIRAYTYDYIERTGRRPNALMPINRPPLLPEGTC
jgi:hypothetical protein